MLRATIIATVRITIFLAAALALAACATTYNPQPVDLSAGPGEIHTATEQDITVSTTILSDKQAEQVYGVDLSSVGMQAVWLRIENHSQRAHWLLVSALDAQYYAPDEAAAQFHSGFDAETEQLVTRHFRELAIPLKTPVDGTTEGYVLTPRHEGGRYIVVLLIGQKHVVNFGFAVTLPDGDFDFERLDPEHIFGDFERPDYDLEEFRAALRDLQCCVTDKSGENSGDPLNLVVVGQAEEVLASMSRAGWSFTHRIDARTVKRMIGAAMSGESYEVAPVSPLYFMGRPQDMALQRARNTIVQRNHLRLWLAPFRFRGKAVWVGQISRDVGIKATTRSPTLTTHVIDPNVDEAREHLLQSLIVAGALEAFAFVTGVGPASASEPRYNLTGDPYFTDGLRLLAVLSGSRSTQPDELEFFEWHNSADPMDTATKSNSGGENGPP